VFKEKGRVMREREKMLVGTGEDESLKKERNYQRKTASHGVLEKRVKPGAGGREESGKCPGFLRERKVIHYVRV